MGSIEYALACQSRRDPAIRSRFFPLASHTLQYNAGMDPLRIVQSQGRTLAIFVRKGISIDTSQFFTSQNDAFQFGMFERPAGHSVRPHRHPGITVESRQAAEFLYIERGEMKVTIFDDAWNVVAEEAFSDGDCMLFLAGGHTVSMLKPTRFIEVKQGPYPGDAQAKVFRDVS